MRAIFSPYIMQNTNLKQIKKKKTYKHNHINHWGFYHLPSGEVCMGYV